jgi:two-component system NtrC family response regulator
MNNAAMAEPFGQETEPFKEPERSLLIVEDDQGLQSQMRWALSDDFKVHIAADRAQAMEIMTLHEPHLVVLDLGLPPDPGGATEGLAILERIVTDYPRTKTIVASGHGDRAAARMAVSAGAYDFFSKPVDIDELKLILDRAWHLHELEEDNWRLASARGPLDGIIAGSPAMLQISRMVEQVAPTDVGVLILGESGTGKEMIARAVHTLSPRAKGPFIALNCAAIPENLLESELFGYERGAFTGAVKQTLGKVEQAKGGTLFLDEIGDMPLMLQAKMLRFLQGRTFQRLGGQSDIVADVRIVSASNRDLAGMTAQGAFREDLYFRLNEVSINVPPLRERSGDAAMIAHVFLQRFAQIYKKGARTFSPSALAAIVNWRWPGNVRELENRVKRAVVLAQSSKITVADLDLADGNEAQSLVTLRHARRKAEREVIERALATSNNNVSQAAKILGISRPTLYSLLQDYDIKIPPK